MFLKQLCKFSSLFIFAGLCCSCADKNTTEKAVVEKSKAYFAGCLAGSESRYEDSSSIPQGKAALYQTAVWSAWVKANQELQEPKLPELFPLKEGKGDSWKLPDELEPNAIMPFKWGYKGEQKPQSGYPLYVYLHGSGDKHAEWETGLSICKAFDDAPSIYFIPQIPNMGDYYRWWQKAKQFAWSRLLRQALISENINPNRIYCFGISEGGYGSQRLASFYADYLAAAGPMAGGEPLKNAPVENCRNIGFSLLTGELDGGFYRNKLTVYTAEEFNRLQAGDSSIFVNRIELMPGCGHGIDYRYTTPWLKKFERNPYPKHVTWENFEMDGWYRDAFYNLAVIERSNDDATARTYYEMNIENNHIDMKVDLVTYAATEIDPHWGIQLKFEKNYTPAVKGKFLIYLNDKLVNLDEEVVLTVNGKEVYRGIPEQKLCHMVNSCATYFDPERIYPAAIEVSLEDK